MRNIRYENIQNLVLVMSKENKKKELLYLFQIWKQNHIYNVT